jgi:hypothetical protein
MNPYYPVGPNQATYGQQQPPSQSPPQVYQGFPTPVPKPQAPAGPSSDAYFCDCGIPAAIRQIKKPGRTCGQWFACCPKPMSMQCEYKKWNVGAPAAGQSGADAGNNNNNNASKPQYAPMGPRLEAVEVRTHDLFSLQEANRQNIGACIKSVLELCRVLTADTETVSREIFVAEVSKIGAMLEAYQKQNVILNKEF